MELSGGEGKHRYWWLVTYKDEIGFLSNCEFIYKNSFIGFFQVFFLTYVKAYLIFFLFKNSYRRNRLKQILHN